MSGGKNFLYGPYREATELAHTYKDSWTRDSIHETLHQGDYGDNENTKWLTSTRQEFKGEPKRKEDQPDILHSIGRDESTLILGFDGNQRYLTTNQDYKSHPLLQASKMCEQDEKTHIPDFCKEYAENRKTEESEYNSMYELSSNEVRPLPKTLEERRKHTNDLRATHFRLGNSEGNELTETQHSFNEQPLSTNSDVRKAKARETYTSKIFRNGDWNQKDRSIISKGLTQNDFPLHSSSIYENHENQTRNMESKYHRKTHFELGSVKNITESAYQKDFLASHPPMNFRRIPFSEPPPSSKLFLDTSDEPQAQRFTTTQMNSYKGSPLDDIADPSFPYRQRLKSSVPMLLKDSPNKKRLSITASDYPEKPIEGRVRCSHLDTGNYDHLTSHYKGDLISEGKAEYKPHELISTARNECELRRRDNKSTHFEFGTSASKLDEYTEQNSQFKMHAPVDPSLRPAGTTLPRLKDYSHVYECLSPGKEKGEVYPISVMKDHYKHYHKQSIPTLSEGRDNLKNKSIDTHFFHLDHHYAGTQHSTTRTDFRPPATLLAPTT